MNSNQNSWYLREDVYFEPLFNQWYAWPYLIPPVTAARHMVHTHRRVMSSFVNNYKLHIMGAQAPGMAGAEFLDCTEEQVQDIRRLIDEINNECGDLVALSEAVKSLDDLVRSHTSGQSLERLYQKVPEPLKGYVELFFDMNHNASYRLFENLLYRSPYYKKSLQSVSFGSLSKVDERPFVLSTPRLPDDNHLQWKVDFGAPALDRVFAAREQPLSTEELESIFAEQQMLGGLHYKELFTSEQPVRRWEPLDSEVRLTYIGHAGFLVESSQANILVDPVIASRPEGTPEGIFSFSQLPDRIDYICLTHTHTDHFNLETLLQLRYKTGKILVPKNNGGTLADPSMRLILKQFGFDVIEVEDLEEIAFQGGRVLSIPFLGEHGDLNIRSKTAWFIEAGGKKFFFGADSSNLDPLMYQHIHRIIGDIDLLAIGMECVGAPYTWIYGALHTRLVAKNIKESRRLNGADFEQAIHMVNTFNPSEVYIYALGLEPWYKYFMGIEYDDDSRQIVESRKMIAACEEMNIPASAMYGERVCRY